MAKKSTCKGSKRKRIDPENGRQKLEPTGTKARKIITNMEDVKRNPEGARECGEKKEKIEVRRLGIDEILPPAPENQYTKKGGTLLLRTPRILRQK